MSETMITAMNEAAYSGCASFYPEAGTICTERGSDHALWCDRCLLRTGAAALAAETARADREAAERQEAERQVEYYRQQTGRMLRARYDDTARDAQERALAAESECDRLRADLDVTREALKVRDAYIEVLESCQDGYYRASESPEAVAYRAILQGAGS